jgi:UDP-3-O-[3-hydroxymyristoyl] glucosamine N-acyltransferase
VPKTLQELADYVGGRVEGDPERVIRGVAGIDEATPEDITFVANPKYVRRLRETRAGAVIVSPGLSRAPCDRLVCENPYLAFARIVEYLMWEPQTHPPGIDPAAHVDPTAEVAPDLVAYPGVHVGPRARIAPGVVLHHGVSVGEDCEIGEATELFPGVRLYPKTRIGARCVIHANVVLGASGFGFAPDGEAWYPIRQVGVCVIEDDVSIGANTTICRGAMGETRIRRGTKIDSNNVISHNCDIGEDCLIISLVGISGTVKVGRHSTLAGQVGIAGHLTVGENSIVGGQAGVTSDLPGKDIYLGSPAIPARKARKAYVLIERLPEMLERIGKLEDEIRRLGGEPPEEGDS